MITTSIYDEVAPDEDDVPLTEEIPPAPGRPLPDEHFYYGVFERMRDLLEQHSEADPVGHVVTAYSYVGCMTGREYSISGRPTTIWPVLVGNASIGRKGTARDDVLRLFDPIEDRSLLPRFSSSAVTESGLIREVRDKSERLDKDGKPADKGEDEKRLWVGVDEFGSVLNAMKNPVFGLQDALCAIYDGRDQQVSTAKGVLRATNQAISVYGNITGEMFAQRFDPEALAGGVLTRLMFFFVDRARYYRGLNVPEEFRQECAALGREIVDTVSVMRNAVGIGKTKPVEFNRDVERWWRRKGHEYLTTEQAGLSGFARMFTARRENNFRRIAGILALTDKTDVVGMQHVRPALSAVDLSMRSIEYIEREFGIAPVAVARTSTLSPRVRKLLAYLEEKRGHGFEEVSRSEIHSKCFNCRLPKEDLAALFQEAADFIQVKKRRDNPASTKGTQFVSLKH